MKKLAIDIVQLSLKFGSEDPLFTDLSFKICKGEFVAIIGPNGSGKTSLIKTIMGLYKPTSGEVHLYETAIGYVPQYLHKDEFSLMTVRELFSLKISGAPFWWGRQKKEMEIKEALRRTKIEEVINRQIKNLSGGEFQRVMIAYALIGNPGLLILDEPISGIDVHGEQDFFNMIEEIHGESGVTIIMISHDIDVVYRYASQVLCLNKSLICLGVPSKVLTKEAIEETFSTEHAIYHHHQRADNK